MHCFQSSDHLGCRQYGRLVHVVNDPQEIVVRNALVLRLPMTTGKSVVLMSGGIDSSATALAILTEGYETSGLFVDYGQPDSLSLTNIQ